MAAVFAGQQSGQTRTLPIFNLASYHGQQSRPLDADLIKDNERSRSSRRSVSDSSLLLRCLNKTLSGKWWQCCLGSRGFGGGGARWGDTWEGLTIWTNSYITAVAPPPLALPLILQKTCWVENEPEVSAPITFQIDFCLLILFKVDASFILAPLKLPVSFQNDFGHLIGKCKKINKKKKILFSFCRPKTEVFVRLGVASD